MSSGSPPIFAPPTTSLHHSPSARSSSVLFDLSWHAQCASALKTSSYLAQRELSRLPSACHSSCHHRARKVSVPIIRQIEGCEQNTELEHQTSGCPVIACLPSPASWLETHTQNHITSEELEPALPCRWHISDEARDNFVAWTVNQQGT